MAIKPVGSFPDGTYLLQIVQTSEGRLRGVLLIEPLGYADERGFLVETYSQHRLEAVGIRTKFVRELQTRSVAGVIRGLHFDRPPGQTKLVRVARGRIVDVVVDIRRGSSTFGQHELFELDDGVHRQLLIPPGFAHGFCAVSDVVDVCYALSGDYDPAQERGIRWDDPDLNIRWPTRMPTLSDRDSELPRLRELDTELLEW